MGRLWSKAQAGSSDYCVGAIGRPRLAGARRGKSETHTSTYSGEDVREIAGADVLVVGLEPVGEAIFAAARQLKLVQRLGVGHDNIDLAAAARYGVRVCNMPDFNAGTVAEHTLMLILALLRRVFESTLLMKASHWPVGTMAANGLFDLQGKTLGILGMTQGVFERQTAAVRVTQHGDAAKPEVRSQGVGIGDELLVRQTVDARPPGATVVAVIVVDEVQDVSERVEPAAQVCVVHAQTAVHDQAGRAGARFDVEQLGAVQIREWHAAAGGLRVRAAPATWRGHRGRGRGRRRQRPARMRAG
jgi:hypothetical protein